MILYRTRQEKLRVTTEGEGAVVTEYGRDHLIRKLTKQKDVREENRLVGFLGLNYLYERTSF